jgi:exo-beta-1,3-glucanase (GH17 family)
MRYPWLGINYANGLNGYVPTGGYPSGQANQDLQYIRQHLASRVRIAMPDWNFPANQINQLHQVALDAMAKGFHVAWGVTSTNTLLTTSNWPQYQAAVLAQAAWAQSVGLHCFFVGNELDSKHDGTLTDAQQRTRLRSLATAVKSSGYSGEVTLSVAQDKIAPWYSEGLGGLDSLGLDLYVQTEATFVSLLNAHVANLGSAAYLAEWNIYNFWETAVQYHSDERIANLVAVRAQHIQDSGITRAYYFCYEHTFYNNRAASDNVWAARLASGNFRRLVQPLMTPRRWLV